ncbi:MAG: DUF58 domain-containing protein, partial [Pseudomonadota bacterium]
AFWSKNRLKGVRVVLPEVVRLSKDREARIDLRIETAGTSLRRLKLGFKWPEEFVVPERVVTAGLPQASSISSLSLTISAARRGRYFLDKCYLETSSLLGFWSVRGAVDLDTEMRVYPNIFGERKNLAALFLRRGGLGLQAVRQVGKGRDFEKLREYSAGDSYEDIYWKATARRGRPITKIFQVERTQEVYLIIDASRLSARKTDLDSKGRGPARTTILERYVTAALIVGLAAERQGDLFGLATFSDRVLSFVRAKNGRTHYNACREALYTLEPDNVTPDFAELFTFIHTRLRRRALLVFLTNMDDPVLAQSFAGNVHLLSRHHLVFCHMINPPGVRPLFSAGEAKSLDDLYLALGGHFQWAGLGEIQKILRQKNVVFSVLESEAMCVALVSQYLSVKQRQAL